MGVERKPFINTMQGWIKIHKQITEHWLWQDADRLKWWLDLLFMANYEDKRWSYRGHIFVLKRGQMEASTSYLAERWGVSRPTIIRFLSLLENEGMILRTTLYGSKGVITICKYDEYQCIEKPGVDTSLDTSLYTSLYTNKEIKEYISSSTSNTRTREERTIKIEEIALYLQGMSDGWKEIVKREIYRRKQVLVDDYELNELFMEYVDNIALTGVSEKEEKDICTHFVNWLRVRLQNEISQENKQRINSSKDGSADRADAWARRDAEFRASIIADLYGN